MTNIRLTYDEGQGDFPVDNDFRRIGIIQDPYEYGTTTFASASTLRGTSVLKVNGATGDYVADEIITQTVTGGTAKGTVVSWDATNGILKYYQSSSIHTDGGMVLAFESDASNAVVGATSTASGTVGHFTKRSSFRYLLYWWSCKSRTRTKLGRNRIHRE